MNPTKSSPKEIISAILMILPLAATLALMVFYWNELPRDFIVLLEPETGDLQTSKGFLMLLVALLPGLLSAWVGYLGLYEKWQYNRRVQRAFLGSAAAVGLSVFAGTLFLTLAKNSGAEPDFGVAMLSTIFAIGYGGICAAVSPPNLTWSNPMDEEQSKLTSDPHSGWLP